MSEQHNEQHPDKGVSQGSGNSYKLVIKGNSGKSRSGSGPHYILRRKLEGETDDLVEEQPLSETEEELEDLIQAEPIASASNVSVYISSLMSHVPDDVNRVVDAIIAEENKRPTNLPTLDDTLSMIFPVSDDSILQGEASYGTPQVVNQNTQKSSDDESHSKNQKYIKKVEYEDL